MSFLMPERALDVLSCINININVGETLSILGPSGCGKSTLLRIIGGLLKPTTGEVSIFGEKPERALARRRVGFMFQKPVLLPWRTVYHNVALPLEVLQESRKKDLVASVLRLVGLDDYKDLYPSQLSGGMQQRVAFARVLVYQPKLLLLDEPFGALDEISRLKINRDFLDLKAKAKLTAILVTHSITEAILLGDHIIVMTRRPAKIKWESRRSLNSEQRLNLFESRDFQDLYQHILGCLE